MSFIRKQIAVNVAARYLQADVSYVNRMLRALEELLPDDFDIFGAVSKPSDLKKLLADKKHLFAPSARRVTAKVATTALAAVDPEGKLFPIMESVSEMGIPGLSGNYESIEDFLRSGLLPFLYDYSLQSESVVPQCKKCSSSLTTVETKSGTISFCMKCGD